MKGEQIYNEWRTNKTNNHEREVYRFFIFKKNDNPFKEMDIDLQKIVSVITDGTTNMLRINTGFVQ